MEEQTALTEEDSPRPSPPAQPASRSASVVARTLEGAIILLCLGGLFLLDSLWATGYVTAALSTVVAASALYEFGRIVGRPGDSAVMSMMLSGSVLVLAQWAGCAFHNVFPDPWTVTVALLCVGALGALGGRAVRGRIEGNAEAVGMTVLGLIYVAVPLGLALAIRVRWGLVGFITMLAVCKATDIGGYYAGTLIGGAKLSPRVSPAKTVAGAIGATVAAMALAVALSSFEWSIMRPLVGLAYGLLLGPVAIAGDLAESALKRQAGVKDSGNLLAGHGGVLDAVDDVLFAAPFSYLFFTLAALQ
jgi:phosphatidate cytidylyltransferase